MKNLARILVMTLLVSLFGVVAVSSLLANPSVQTPLVATTSYNATTGIRWNNGFGVFEVFNANGISYIGSNAKIDDAGNISETGEEASGDKTYNIMQDIAYDASFESTLEAGFASGTRYSIGEAGVVNGRGFILKNFPISQTAGTAFFSSNSGTIQNLTVLNPRYTSGVVNTGILCNTNWNVIDNCEVAGEALNLGGIVINVAAIAYTGDGTIRNCINKLDITTSGQYAAGILARSDDAIIFNCMNVGNISSIAGTDSFSGGIAAFMSMGSVYNCINYGDISANDAGGILGNCVRTRVNGNKNYAVITGVATAYGIIGGVLYDFSHSGNESYGETKGEGAQKGECCNSITSPDFGIKFVSEGEFEITSAIGLSYIASGLSFSNTGKIVGKGEENSGIASNTATYTIVNDIEYSSTGLFTNEPITPGGAVKIYGKKPISEGSGFEPVTLSNFPIRKIGASGTYSALFGTLSEGTIIDGINLKTNSTTTGGNTGVFFYSGKASISNCKVSATTPATGSNYDITSDQEYNIGAFSFDGSGTFDNCTNELSINTKGNRVGGFVAKPAASLTFEDCTNKAKLTSTGPAPIKIGGYVGLAEHPVTITDSSNSGAVNGVTAGEISGGGFVGQINNDFKATNCENSATIEVNGYGFLVNEVVCVGGLVGNANGYSVIVDCENAATGSIIGYGTYEMGAFVGGLAGRLISANRVREYTDGTDTFLGTLILRPVNRGKVTTPQHCWAKSEFDYHMTGGIVGAVDASFPEGRVTIQGNPDEGVIENTASAWIGGGQSSIQSAGGIVGSVYLNSESTDVVVRDCTNAAAIVALAAGTGPNRAGGIVGSTSSKAGVLKIINCDNLGDVSVSSSLVYGTKDSRAGGIFGAAFVRFGGVTPNHSVVITDCVNHASSTISVKGSVDVEVIAGGIAGEMLASSVINEGLIDTSVGGSPLPLTGSGIINSVNRGRIVLQSPSFEDYGVGMATLGGIVGRVGTANGCWFTLQGNTNSIPIADGEGFGIIESIYTNIVAGGLIGRIDGVAGANVAIKNCTNNVGITLSGAGAMAGGIFGVIYGPSFNLQMEGNLNNGVIDSTGDNGFNGFITGFVENSTLAATLTCDGTGSSTSTKLIGNSSEQEDEG